MTYTQLLEKARELLGQERGLTESGFTDLYESQLSRVLNYVRYRANPAEAEDLTANIFARAWDLRAQYDARRGPAETWLWAIARSAIADYWRGRQSAVETVIPDTLPSARRPDEEADHKLEWERLQVSLKRLPPMDREIIALRFGGGQTNRAIAKLLELNEANVAQHLRRALRKLRLDLEGENPDANNDR